MEGLGFPGRGWGVGLPGQAASTVWFAHTAAVPRSRQPGGWSETQRSEPQLRERPPQSREGSGSAATWHVLSAAWPAGKACCHRLLAGEALQGPRRSQGAARRGYGVRSGPGDTAHLGRAVTVTEDHGFQTCPMLSVPPPRSLCRLHPLPRCGRHKRCLTFFAEVEVPPR